MGQRLIYTVLRKNSTSTLFDLSDAKHLMETRSNISFGVVDPISIIVQYFTRNTGGRRGSPGIMINTITFTLINDVWKRTSFTEITRHRIPLSPLVIPLHTGQVLIPDDHGISVQHGDGFNSIRAPSNSSFTFDDTHHKEALYDMLSKMSINAMNWDKLKEYDNTYQLAKKTSKYTGVVPDSHFVISDNERFVVMTGNSSIENRWHRESVATANCIAMYNLKYNSLSNSQSCCIFNPFANCKFHLVWPLNNGGIIAIVRDNDNQLQLLERYVENNHLTNVCISSFKVGARTSCDDMIEVNGMVCSGDAQCIYTLIGSEVWEYIMKTGEHTLLKIVDAVRLIRVPNSNTVFVIHEDMTVSTIGCDELKTMET